MNKRDIEQELSRNLEAHHWSLSRLCAIHPPAFARNIDVTPAFIPNIIRKAGGVYLVNGSLGLICQKFERKWISRSDPGKHESSINRFCLVSNTSNVPELLGTSYIHGNQPRRDLDAYLASLNSVLERMPHDMSSLASIFRGEQLLGLPLETFVAYGQEDKFKQLREYVLSETAQ